MEIISELDDLLISEYRIIARQLFDLLAVGRKSSMDSLQLREDLINVLRKSFIMAI
jgi:hypothetical protein